MAGQMETEKGESAQNLHSKAVPEGLVKHSSCGGNEMQGT